MMYTNKAGTWISTNKTSTTGLGHQEGVLAGIFMLCGANAISNSRVLAHLIAQLPHRVRSVDFHSLTDWDHLFAQISQAVITHTVS